MQEHLKEKHIAFVAMQKHIERPNEIKERQCAMRTSRRGTNQVKCVHRRKSGRSGMLYTGKKRKTLSGTGAHPK